MAPVTEIAFASLKPGSEITPDSSSPAARIVAETFETVASQPGFQRCYWGAQLENPSNLVIFMDWDSVDDHIRFTKSDVYGPFFKTFTNVLESAPRIFHAAIAPLPKSKAVGNTVAPVTEVGLAYFPPDYTEEEMRTTEEKHFQPLIKAANGEVDEVTGAVGGWSLEKDIVSDKGEKSRVYQFSIGWPSKEAHMKFRETERFKAHLAPTLRSAPRLVGMEVVHVSFNEVQQGPGSVEGNQSMQEEVLNPQTGAKNSAATTKDGMSTKYTK